MRRITLTWEDTKSGSLILVTPKYGLSEAGRPKALCRVRQNGTSVLGRYAAPDSQTEDAAKDRGILLEKETAAMLLGLLSQIRSEDRITLVSGYRSREEQVQIWEDTLEKEGEAFTRTYVAKPGHSEHESGLAVDLAESQEEIDFICPQFPREGICGEFRKSIPLGIHRALSGGQRVSDRHRGRTLALPVCGASPQYGHGAGRDDSGRVSVLPERKHLPQLPISFFWTGGGHVHGNLLSFHGKGEGTQVFMA